MTLVVLETGLLTTVQDAGRPGQAASGVGRAGACDRTSYALANRLVGNHPGAAVLEVTFGGLVLRAEDDVVVATTGARCAGPWPHGPWPHGPWPHGPWPHNAPTQLRAGQEFRLGAPVSGVRTYLAVRGGLVAPSALGSCSTDLLSGLGPPVVAAGDRLPVGRPTGPMPSVDVAPVAEPAGGEVVVPISSGPRRDWFPADAWTRLVSSTYEVGSDSNRIGLRLTGAALRGMRPGELPSEGMVRGALQVPPSGLPVLLLADAPVTGGYPVIAYVDDDAVDRCAQLRPGQVLRFRV